MPSFDSNDPSSFGWSLNNRQIVPYTFAGHQFYSGLDARVVPVFDHFLSRLQQLPGFAFHTGLGPGDGDWGYEQRNIGSSATPSFHEYGLAIDINAPWNPQLMTNPPASVYRVPDAVDAIALELGLLWGGNARFGPNWDRMHVECHLSPAEVGAPAPAGHVTPWPLAPGRFFGPASAGQNAVTGYGIWSDYNTDVKAIQRVVGVAQDGYYGTQTAAAVRAEQRFLHVTVDGLVGPITWRGMVL